MRTNPIIKFVCVFITIPFILVKNLLMWLILINCWVTGIGGELFVIGIEAVCGVDGCYGSCCPKRLIARIMDVERRPKAWLCFFFKSKN
jgi:hypothetical protein